MDESFFFSIYVKARLSQVTCIKCTRNENEKRLENQII